MINSECPGSPISFIIPLDVNPDERPPSRVLDDDPRLFCRGFEPLTRTPPHITFVVFFPGAEAEPAVQVSLLLLLSVL